MKKLLYTIAFVLVAMVAMVAISSCTEQNIKPAGGAASDPCQFGEQRD